MTEQTFDDLMGVLRKFQLRTAPASEKEIEDHLQAYLRARGYPARRQIVVDSGRNDLVVGRFALELKMFGSRSCVDQLDRYSVDYEGLILVCWKASGPLRKIFKMAVKTAKIPIALIELNGNCEIV